MRKKVLKNKNVSVLSFIDSINNYALRKVPDGL